MVPKACQSSRVVEAGMVPKACQGARDMQITEALASWRLEPTKRTIPIPVLSAGPWAVTRTVH